MRKVFQHRTRLAGTVGMAAGALLGVAGGCARPYGVPITGQLVAEAPGQTCSFQAPDEGTVYVDGPGRPGQSRHLIYTGLVTRGQTVTVSPEERMLLVDGKPVPADIPGGRDSFYQIWYRPLPHDLLLTP